MRIDFDVVHMRMDQHPGCIVLATRIAVPIDLAETLPCPGTELDFGEM
jgi:hypothetical protein